MFVTSKKFKSSTKSQEKLCANGLSKEKLNLLQPKKDIEDIKSSQLETNRANKKLHLRKSLLSKTKKDLQKQISFITQEYLEHEVIELTGLDTAL